jgi:hypothetical protein
MSNLKLTQTPSKKSLGPFVVNVTMVALPAVTSLTTQYSKPVSPVKELLQFNGSISPTSPVPTNKTVPREPSGKKVTTSAPPVTLDVLSATEPLSVMLATMATTSILLINNAAQKTARLALLTTYVTAVN